MGSIPLPALDVRPPQQADPLEQYKQIASLKSLQQAQMLQQQQLQGAQQENQMRQQQMTDQQAATSAMKEWDGKDFNQLPALVLKHGGSAQIVTSMKQGLVKYQSDLATLSKEQLGNEKTKNDFIAQQVDNVKSLPPAQQAAAFEKAKADLVQKGYLDPQQAQGIQYQGPEQLDILEKSFMGHAAAVEAQEKQAQTSKALAQGQEATVKAQQAQRTLAGTSPTGITAEQQQISQQRGQQLRLESQRNFMESQRVKMEGERLQQQKDDKGTLSLVEDATGKPMLFNNKTGKIDAAPGGISKAGTYQKTMGGAEESTQYANDYLQGKNFTGPGDEALMEKFFDVAKPASGFRMTQPQMDMLNHARDAYQGLIARGKHLLSPNAPYFDDTQREHIVNTMNDILAAKRKAHGGGGPAVGSVEGGYRFKGGDPGKQENWEKVP